MDSQTNYSHSQLREVCSYHQRAPAPAEEVLTSFLLTADLLSELPAAADLCQRSPFRAVRSAPATCPAMGKIKATDGGSLRLYDRETGPTDLVRPSHSSNQDCSWLSPSADLCMTVFLNCCRGGGSAPHHKSRTPKFKKHSWSDCASTCASVIEGAVGRNFCEAAKIESVKKDCVSEFLAGINKCRHSS